MLAIATTTANTDGNVIIDWKGDPRENTARVSRSATLDGGAVITHSGVSDGDRTISIRNLEISETTADKLWDIFNDETSVLISVSDGVYSGVIKTCKINNGLLNLTLLFESKESA